MKKIILTLSILLFFSTLSANEKLLAVNKDGNNLSIIDTQTGEVLDTIKTGNGPHEVAVTPNKSKAIVTNYGYGCGENAGRSLTVVNLQDNSSYDVNLGKYRAPHGIQTLNDNKTVAVTVECSDALILVDIEQKTVIKEIPTKSNVSHMVVLSKDEKLAFVANIGSGSVSVINLHKAQLIKNINTGSGAEGIDITPEGNHIWVSNRADDSVSVIEIEKLAVVKTIDVEQMPIRVKFHPNKSLALVSNAKSATVALIDTNTFKVIQQLKMSDEVINNNGNVFSNGPVPIGIVFSKDGNYAYVANTNVDEIRQIKMADFKVKKILKAGKRPDGLAVVQ
jgi:YVTN family beta-propeller protein